MSLPKQIFRFLTQVKENHQTRTSKSRSTTVYSTISTVYSTIVLIHLKEIKFGNTKQKGFIRRKTLQQVKEAKGSLLVMRSQREKLLKDQSKNQSMVDQSSSDEHCEEWGSDRSHDNLNFSNNS